MTSKPKFSKFFDSVQGSGGQVVELRPTLSVPTNAVFAEQVILGGVMLEASLATSLDWLLPEHFFLKAHGHIWHAIQTLVAAASGPLPADPWATDIVRELIRAGRYEDAGGLAAITRLVDLVPEVLDYEKYAEDIYQAWHQRQLELFAVKLAASARHSAIAPDALILDAERGFAALQSLARAPDAQGTSIGKIANSFVTDLDAQQRGEGNVLALYPTGFTEVDRLAKGGAAGGELWVLGGRPGLGKTSLAMNICANMAFDQNGCLVFSLEMDRTQLAKRVLSSESGVEFAEGDLPPEQVQALYEAAERIRRLPVIIDDTPSLTIDEIEQRAKRKAMQFAAKGKDLRLIVVDYIQIVSIATVPGRNRREEIREISRRLKMLARNLNCTVVALAQLNRSGEQEQRRPRATDIAECDNIARDADWIGILWRQKNTPEWVTDLAICKQRRGQAEADIKLSWQAQVTRFGDV